MARKRDNLNSKISSRTIVINTSNSKIRELFLSLAMDQVRNYDVKISANINKVELEVFGEFEVIDDLIKKLQNLEDSVYNALQPDQNGKFHYHKNLLSKLFTPPIGLILFNEVVSNFGFISKIDSNGILTNSSIEELKEIHGQTVEVMSTLPRVNKDIKRFLTILALELGKNPNYILKIGLDQGLIRESTNGMFFTTEYHRVKKELITAISLETNQEINFENNEIKSYEDLLFDGGKMLFLRNGEEVEKTELDHSFYDHQNTINDEEVDN